LKLPLEFENKRKDLEFISEKTRYKIILTLLAEDSLSFTQLRNLLTSIPENSLNYHIKILKENGYIKNKKVQEYKRSEPRSFYSLSNHTKGILEDLGLSDLKKEFHALIHSLTDEIGE
jgi:DNA-binding HxlR family transcriptional regulator